MPGGDRTGPRGEGPMTGRRAGYCAGNDAPGFTAGRGGRGWFGMGRGRGGGFFGGGRGFRNIFRATGLTGWMRGSAGGPYEPATREQRLEALSGEESMLERALAEVRRRMEAVRGEEKKGG